MKNYIVGAYLLLFASNAFGLLVSSDEIEEQLTHSVIVAEIEIVTSTAQPHPQFSIKKESTARILRILQTQPDGGWLPAEGDSITLWTLGGERDQTGVIYNGFPRPFVGKRYQAHLKRSTGQSFEIAGWEFGLQALGGGREYSRNRTDGSNGEGTGPYLFWDDTFFPIPYYISEPSFRGNSDFVLAIDASFKTWRDLADIKVEFIPMGCSSSRRNDNDGVNNVVLVTENWPFDTSAIAITRNFYIAGSSAHAGQILDSDILLNAVHHKFTTTNEAGKHDVQNIVTHEIGHFLGLGHEVNPVDTDASMFKVASPNEFKKRILHESDLKGIRAAYSGVGRKISFYTPSCEVTEPSTGCAAVHNKAFEPSSLIFSAFVMLFLMGIARLLIRST